MMLRMTAGLLALAAALPSGGEAAAQDVPFGTGERLNYDVKFGPIKVGSGAMEVVGIETIRGRPAWRTRFTVKGGTFFYKVNDVLESWIDTRSFESLRFVQDFEEGGRHRERRYEIFPERREYIETTRSDSALPSVEDPLDDGSFLYFVRTVPLEVGQEYSWDRYFKPDRNPVRVRVLRKERIRVPAGTFETVVLQPIIKARGIFSEDGEAQIWLTDDDRRMMVQMKSKLSFGSLNLYLKSYQPATTTTANGTDR